MGRQPVDPDGEALGIGIYRISEDAGRKAAGTLTSDVTQQETIENIAKANRIQVPLADMLDETNVSGGTPLEKRPYGQAIARVEDPCDPVQAIIFAYRSRHDRDVIEGAKAIKRMDNAGGVLLVGGTILTHATPQKWFEATAGSLMSEWQKREIAYSVGKGVQVAVGQGRIPYPSAPLGLELYGPHNNVRPVDDRQVVAIVQEAFEMRDRGETIDAVRQFLAEHGHVRTYRSVCRMLGSPLYIGELRYGGHVRPDGSVTPEYLNPDLGYAPIVSPDLWERVQAKRVLAGRKGKSDRLLARLGVLLCASCGGRMIAGANMRSGRRHTFYRCGRGRAADCPQRAVIHAERIEGFVIDTVKRELADAEARETSIREAREAADDAQAAEDWLEDAEVKYLELGPGTHERAKARLDQLRADAEVKRGRADRLSGRLENVDVLRAPTVLDNPDPRALPAKRALIRSVMAGRVTVRPGRLPFEERVIVAPHSA